MLPITTGRSTLDTNMHTIIYVNVYAHVEKLLFFKIIILKELQGISLVF